MRGRWLIPPDRLLERYIQPAHPAAPFQAALLKNYFQLLPISLDLSKNILTSEKPFHL